MFLRAGLSVVRRFHGQSLLGNLPKVAKNICECLKLRPIQWQKQLTSFGFVSKKFI